MDFFQKVRDLDLYVPESSVLPVRLDANESCFPLPQDVIESITKAVGEVSFNRYPDPSASEICRLMAGYCSVPPECVVAGNGSDELISLIISLLGKGGKVVVCHPDFSMYSVYASLSECHIVQCKRNDGLPDIDALTEQGKNADLVIFSNPCNPTGRGIEREKILFMLQKLSCLCVIDEAYMDFWNQSVLDCIDRYKNLVVLKTCSKNLGLAAIRLGFAVTNPETAAIIRSVKSPYNVNAVTQAIGEVVLSRPQLLKDNTERILKAKEYLVSQLLGWVNGQKDCKLINTEANFIVLETPRTEQLHQSLKQRGIAVRAFQNCLRITVGTESETDALLEGLKSINNT